ncbi:MAG: xylulokinase [Gammaproteobacteria bacterium]|jgi:xylulokinase
MYLLGYDIGSSSIKAALIRAEDGLQISVVQYPEKEMDIMAPQAGWAEQQPEDWWENLCKVTTKLLQNNKIAATDIKGIGIAYQMHGLVLVDKDHKVLRPSIIWCDSRALQIGQQAFQEMGEEYCLSHLLNSPGNFTASKLKWVKDQEPKRYERIHKIMLPGDYIAMKLTGEICTTVSGLSEGIFWDFKNDAISDPLMNYYGFDKSLIPNIKNTFSLQGTVSKKAALETGLAEGIPITYRAGDQPNNALSLNVLHPGEVAATGGTSGVVYGIVDTPSYDIQSRVNGFAHVNHEKGNPHIGVLLCINGAGIQYSWLKHQVAHKQESYESMEEQLSKVPVGADGLRILPFGNGAERMLSNQSPGAHMINLNFNRHDRAHLYRAGLEGIAFSFVYGMKILKEMGLNLSVIRVGNDNLFQSHTFSTTIATLVDSKIEVMKTTGAIGAAKAAGVATGIYASLEEAMSNNEMAMSYIPLAEKEEYQAAYDLWERDLEGVLSKSI